MSLNQFVLVICALVSIGHARFVIKSFKDCKKGFDYPAKLDASFKTVGDSQLMNLDIMYPEPMDSSVQFKFSVDAMADKKSNPVRLMSNTQQDMCEALHKYLGGFMVDIGAKMGMKNPESCPIPAGTYHLKDYPLTYDHIPIQNLPFSDILVTVEATKGDASLFCKYVKVANIS